MFIFVFHVGKSKLGARKWLFESPNRYNSLISAPNTLRPAADLILVFDLPRPKRTIENVSSPGRRRSRGHMLLFRDRVASAIVCLRFELTFNACLAHKMAFCHDPQRLRVSSSPRFSRSGSGNCRAILNVGRHFVTPLARPCTAGALAGPGVQCSVRTPFQWPGHELWVSLCDNAPGINFSGSRCDDDDREMNKVRGSELENPPSPASYSALLPLLWCALNALNCNSEYRGARTAEQLGITANDSCRRLVSCHEKEEEEINSN